MYRRQSADGRYRQRGLVGHEPPFMPGRRRSRRILALVPVVASLLMVALSASEADAADTIRTAVPAASSVGHPVTAYVANSGSGTVTPIPTATNTARKPIPVGSGPFASRSRRMARPPTSPTRTRRHGDPDQHRHQHRRPRRSRSETTPAIAITPDGETAYVTNVDIMHSDPDQDRHQHRRRPDPGRNRPSDIAITPDGKTAYVTNVTSDTVTPIDTATNTAGPPIRPAAARCHRDHAGRQDRLRRRRDLRHGDPDRHRH